MLTYMSRHIVYTAVHVSMNVCLHVHTAHGYTGACIHACTQTFEFMSTRVYFHLYQYIIHTVHMQSHIHASTSTRSRIHKTQVATVNI